MSTPADVRDAVIRAHYARLMASPDAARARAQAAYGIASAIAVVIVTAGFVGDLDSQPPGVQAVSVVALIAWLVTAALFLHTVSSAFEIDVVSKSSEDVVVAATLDGIRDERARIDAWQRRAQFAAAVAALLTVVAFVAALRADRGQAEETAMITVSAAESGSLEDSCGPMPATLVGKVAESSLREKFVNVTLDPGMCGPASVRVAVPRGAILGLAFRRPPAAR